MNMDIEPQNTASCGSHTAQATRQSCIPVPRKTSVFRPGDPFDRQQCVAFQMWFASRAARIAPAMTPDRTAVGNGKAIRQAAYRQ